MSSEVRRGFTIAELIIVIILTIVVAVILLPTCTPSSRSAPNVVAQAHLRSLSTGAANYAGDVDGRIFHFGWEKGKTYIGFERAGQINVPETNEESFAFQVQNILMRGTGRIKGESRIEVPKSINVSHRYSHLVLLDYLTDRQPEPIAASPTDKNLIEWQEHPLWYLGKDSDVPYGKGMPKEAGYDTDPIWLDNSVKQLWAFGSSYQVVPHAWVDDVDPQYTPSAESPHHLVMGESEKTVGKRNMTEVKYPSQKVFMYEEFDRFTSKKGIYASDPSAKTNLAFFDGSVRQEKTSDSMSAQDEGHPEWVWEQSYVPLDTFPHPLGGLGDRTKLDLRFRWTKGGLSGFDYD